MSTPTTDHTDPTTGTAAPDAGGEGVPRLHVVDAEKAAKLRTAWTADALMAMTFADPVWAVPGIIAEGVSLLCGPPKVGKSWMSLALGLAVASGGTAFGAIPVEGGPVLYLALEDTPRRLQNRMRILLGDQLAPAGLTLATTCPLMGQGGDEAIAHWLDRNRDARMVVVDVFAKIRGGNMPGSSAYDADYAAVGRLKKLADRYAVPFVLVHHVRKMASEDFLAEVSGTNGIAGAADSTIVLKRARGQADGVLFVTGRDVDECEYALSFQPSRGAWTLLDGSPEEHQTTDTRAAILRYLRAHPASGPRVIAEGTGLGEPNVKATCRRMLAAGQLAADAKARYSVPDGDAE